MKLNLSKLVITGRLFRISGSLTNHMALHFLRLLALVVMASLLLGTLPPVIADEQEVQVRFSFDQKIDDLWADLPQISERPNVTLTSGTEPSCANAALRKARFALTQSSVRAAGLKALSLTVKVAKELLKAYGIPYVGDAADIITKYLESSSPEEFAQKMGEFVAGKAGEKAGGKIGSDYITKTGAKEAAKAFYKSLTESKTYFRELTFDDPSCGRITITIYLKPHPSKPGAPALHLIASGDCRCEWPSNVSRDQQLGPWQVIAYAELTPTSRAVNKNTVEVTFGLGERQYEVFAKCGCNNPAASSRPDSTTSGPSDDSAQPKEDIVDRICFKQCDDLYQEWRRLQDELAKARAFASDPEVMSDKQTAERVLDLVRKRQKAAAEAKAKLIACLQNCLNKSVAPGATPPDATRVLHRKHYGNENFVEPPPIPEKAGPKPDEPSTKEKKGKDEKAKGKKGKIVVEFSDEVRKTPRPVPEKEKKEEKSKTSTRKKVSKVSAIAVAGILSGSSHRKKKSEPGSREKREQ